MSLATLPPEDKEMRMRMMHAQETKTGAGPGTSPGSSARILAARVLALALAAGLVPVPAGTYPLDGRARTGIRRLDGFRKAQESTDKRVLKLPPGALLGTDDVKLHLTEKGRGFDLSEAAPDPALKAALESIVKDRDPSYALAVADITDPQHIVWAGVREDLAYYPGSVGKTLCMIALFDGLRRAFPDTAVREKVLRETWITATDWIIRDSHTIPKFDEATGLNTNSPPAVGERYTLAEWVDHMVSPSANAAGAMVWKEAILLRQFGTEYPVSKEKEDAFFKVTSKAELSKLALQVIEEPLVLAGIDAPEHIRQGTMWTRTGQSRIPGTASYATPRELVRLLLRIEQGRMVDAWSSLEMKRYLYQTKKRYRYTYAPELKDAAVYFKSGSLFECAPEPDFKCVKYKGNVKNIMNSIAIVESPSTPGPDQKRYIVALMSNVLRKNSAWDHSRLAAAIEQAVRSRSATVVKEEGSAADVTASGKGE